MSKHFEIIVGTMLGASEYVADAIAEKLSALGHSYTIHPEPNLDDIKTQSTWVVCTSTHGAGELPDNIQPFAKQLDNQSLSNTAFLVVGLGDSSYDTYCHGSIHMENTLQQANAKLLSPAFHIDVLNHPIPEDRAVEWLTNWLENNAQSA